MKKMSFLIILSFVILSSASSFAAVTFDNGGPTGTFDFGPDSVMNDFRASNNVTVIGVSGADRYAVTSGHLNGDRQFGSSSGDSQLYWQSKETNAAPEAPASSDSSQFATGWTSL